MKRIKTTSMAATRKLRAAASVIRHFRNWYEVIPAVLRGKRPRRIRLRNGIVLEAPENSSLYDMAKEVFIQGVYTPPGMEIEPDDVVVDIGANVGCFSLLAASRTHKNVCAFEPFPENVEFLEKNLRANSCRNVSVGCLAVSDRCGRAKLYLSDNSGGHLLFPRNITGELQCHLEVYTVTLERILRDYAIDYIGFLKIDCEGAEGQILRSVPVECLERVGKIAMEFHDNVSVLHHSEIVDLLEQRGFSCSLNWNGVSPFGYVYARRS